MTPDEREDFEERCAIVADGNRISQDEATTLVRSWWLDAQTRESFTDAARREAVRLRLAGRSAPGQNRVVGTRYGR